MLFSVRNVALIALSLTTFVSAAPVEKERDVQVQAQVQERAAGNAATLIHNIDALTTIITTAKTLVLTSQGSGGLTAGTVTVRAARVQAIPPDHES
jgi:hypothetical protein